MKKRLLLYTTILFASCCIFSRSEDDDPDWIITKRIYEVSYSGKMTYTHLLELWEDTIYNKSEEYIMAETALFQSKTTMNREYRASYRKF